VHTTFANQQRLDRWDALITVVLIIFVAALFVLFLAPPMMSDQLDYFYHAWRLDELKLTHRHLRVGLIWPIAFAIRWFGYSELSYYAIPAFAAFLLVAGTWIIGRLLFGRWVGFLAGILVVYNPWVLDDFTGPLPDFLAAGLFCTGMAVLIWCWREGRLADKPMSWRDVGLLGLAGLLFGWSYLTREFVVVFFPLAGFVFLAAKSRPVGLLPLMVAAISCWLAELAWGIARYGYALARLHAVSSSRTGLAGMYIESDPIRILTQLPSTFLDRPGGWIMVALLLGGAVFSVVRAARGDRRWQLLAMGLIGGWVFFHIHCAAAGTIPRRGALISPGAEVALLVIDTYTDVNCWAQLRTTLDERAGQARPGPAFPVRCDLCHRRRNPRSAFYCDFECTTVLEQFRSGSKWCSR
jgi:hypothetical protein